MAALVAALTRPARLRAHVQTRMDFHGADVAELRSKFVGLAQACPEERYAWKPMDGTRRVGGVLGRAAGGGRAFPANWNQPAAQGAARGYEVESARLDSLSTSKAQLITELERAFDHLGRSLAGMSESARAADGKTWGRDMKVDAGITMALSDMHEHLGQLIAYARMNRIVPPWSR
jgi:hypothetical protein